MFLQILKYFIVNDFGITVDFHYIYNNINVDYIQIKEMKWFASPTNWCFQQISLRRNILKTTELVSFSNNAAKTVRPDAEVQDCQ